MITFTNRWHCLAIIALANTALLLGQEVLPEAQVGTPDSVTPDSVRPLTDPTLPAAAGTDEVPVPQATNPSPRIDQMGEEEIGGILDSEYDLSALPQITNGRYSLPRLEPPSTATIDIGNGRTPERYYSEEPERPLPETGSERGEPWNWSVVEWSAPNTFSFPRYFEDRMLERHGHQRFGLCQSAVSGARFFGSFGMLPYHMTVRPGNEPEYTLGYYRSGSNVPGFFQRPPLDRDGILVQSATAAGLILIFP